MRYDLRQAFLPWRILRFLGILVVLLALFTIEFAVSLPIAAASFFVHFVLRLHWLESWLLTLVFSLAVAAMYLVAWPAVFALLIAVVLCVLRWSSSLIGHSFQIVAVGVLLGVFPVVAFDLLITERVIGLSVISIVAATVAIRQLQVRRG